MEKIIIKNFLIFDDVEMEIKRLNILIGEQASGKSLLAKLVYFCKGIPLSLANSCSTGKALGAYVNELVLEFESIFPKKLWNSTDFSIHYSFMNQSHISIKLVDNVFKIKFSKELQNKFNDIHNQYTSFYNEIEKRNSPDIFDPSRTILVVDLFRQAVKIFRPDINIFVPANRSLFSLIERNSFTLLSGNMMNIDVLTQDFSERIQGLKQVYKASTDSYLEKHFQAVLKGSYQQISGEDYIINNKSQVPLNLASSGQQEFFPLMLLLSFHVDRDETLDFGNLFIEEPEAHLFPKAQNSIVSALLYILDKTETNLFITTHSPYILSAVNNAILANDMVGKGKISIEDYIEMSDGAYPISLDDVSAYSMDAGKITNIKDEDYRMIGGDVLDEVSNHFGEVMDKLLDLDDDLGGNND